jgi:hypothetical protein
MGGILPTDRKILLIEAGSGLSSAWILWNLFSSLKHLRLARHFCRGGFAHDGEIGFNISLLQRMRIGAIGA